MIQKYARRPEPVEVIRYLPWKHKVEDMMTFCHELVYDQESNRCQVRSGNGVRVIMIGDFIVKDDQGNFEFYHEHEFKEKFMLNPFDPYPSEYVDNIGRG